MKRLLAMPLMVAIAVCVAGEPKLDLLKIGHMPPKGRVQDRSADPVVAAILETGKEAIPILIELLESDRLYDSPPFDYWPEVHEGDVALVILGDLFLDPTWTKSTLPELCWDNVLERSASSTPGWELLSRYVDKYGRSSLADRWRVAWTKHRESIVWDEEGRFFRVAGHELVSCR